MRPVNTDTLPHLVNCFWNNLRCWITTKKSLFSIYYWKISIGNNNRFYGVPIFRRLPGSRIVIGDRCTFRSAVWSNYVGINHPCILATLSEHATISIGDDCGFSSTSIASAKSLTIGNRVMVGANTTINDTDWHPVDPKRRIAGSEGESSPITIEDDVWLGANVIILKGVTIGQGSVIAANSVVTQSIPPFVIAGGNPAKFLKNIIIE